MIESMSNKMNKKITSFRKRNKIHILEYLTNYDGIGRNKNMDLEPCFLVRSSVEQSTLAASIMCHHWNLIVAVVSIIIDISFTCALYTKVRIWQYQIYEPFNFVSNCTHIITHNVDAEG